MSRNVISTEDPSYRKRVAVLDTEMGKWLTSLDKFRNWLIRSA